LLGQAGGGNLPDAYDPKTAPKVGELDGLKAFATTLSQILGCSSSLIFKSLFSNTELEYYSKLRSWLFMIVNLTEKGWEVIYHRAHALLAAQLAGYWRTRDATARLVETVAAISHHDDLEREWEGNELTEAGAPLDFTLSKQSPVEQLAENVTNARYRGRWVALLTSMHMSFLNEPKRGDSAELDKFLDQQLELQQQWRQGLKLTKNDADKAYAFMQWCDRLSLILCPQELPVDEHALEITKGPDGQRYDVVQRSDGSVSVKSWPFKEERFTVSVEACYLSQIKFEDNASLRAALQIAPIKTLEWTFVK